MPRLVSRYGPAPSEVGARIKAERTPLRVIGERNPGGCCPECGQSHGHRMDCCFA